MSTEQYNISPPDGPEWINANPPRTPKNIWEDIPGIQRSKLETYGRLQEATGLDFSETPLAELKQYIGSVGAHTMLMRDISRGIHACERFIRWQMEDLRLNSQSDNAEQTAALQEEWRKLTSLDYEIKKNVDPESLLTEDEYIEQLPPL